MRGQLGDRSAAGVTALTDTLQVDVARVRAFDKAGLDHQTRTSLADVESAYDVALAGFARPYVHAAVGGWSNTPYVVTQNVRALPHTSQFLLSEHHVTTYAAAKTHLH